MKSLSFFKSSIGAVTIRKLKDLYSVSPSNLSNGSLLHKAGSSKNNKIKSGGFFFYGKCKLLISQPTIFKGY